MEPCNIKLEKGGKCNFLKIINFYFLPLYVPQLMLCTNEAKCVVTPLSTTWRGWASVVHWGEYCYGL